MKDKKTLITIIVLLVIMFPLGLTGTIKHFSVPKKAKIPENANKDFVFSNYVYFYLEESLLGTYACNNCSSPEVLINEDGYYTNSYKGGKEKFEPVVNSFYAIFKKGDKTVLYSISSKKIISEYKYIKTYGVSSNNKFLIYENENGYGVTFFELGKMSIPSEYDYIALPGHFENGLLDSTQFIVKQNNMWSILKDDGLSTIKATEEEIVDFNNRYYITYSNGKYYIYDYDGELHENMLPKTNIYGVGKYLFILNNSELYVYEDIDGDLVTYENVGEYNDIYFNKTEEGIEIVIDGNVSKTLDLS